MSKPALKDRPDLDSVSVFDATGHRTYVYPADARGRFSRLKPWVYLVLIVIYVALPWIEINGNPAVLINIPDRRFFLFGATFNAQDVYMFFFILTGIGFALIVVAALWGRLWCGWACPQTVFLDGVFRRIERWIEGPAAKRRRLADAPMSAEKFAKKGLKHVIYLALSFLIAHVFLSYFTGTDKLVAMIGEGPGAHSATFAWGFVMTALFYGNFWWFREQLCIVICPYGRLQSVLQDKDTVTIGYDMQRGEPRGKKSDPNAGDCVDCGRCIAVCPTRIDIRAGHQLECIGCAYCIDACDEIMTKIGRDKGLIRYDSERGFETGERRFWRPRVFVYGVAGIVGLVVAGLTFAGNDPFEADILRARGIPYTMTDEGLRNTVRLHVVNKANAPTVFTLAPDEADVAMMVVPQREVRLNSFEDAELPIIVEVSADAYQPGMKVGVTVHDSVSGITEHLLFKILGPPNKILAKKDRPPPRPAAERTSP